MNFTNEEAGSLTADLVRYSSITGTDQVLDCAEFIRDWFVNNRIEAEIITYHGVPNVTAHVGKKGGKRLLLDGHFDVVPPGKADEWKTDPFRPVIRDGYIYGRGVGDMKSGIAAAMLAMRELKKKEDGLKGEVVFYGVGDEETGSVNGTISLLQNYDKAFDGAVVPEPTDFCIERAQRGLRWIRFHVIGKACHAGRPHCGKNAIEQSMLIIQKLKSLTYNAHMELFEEGLKEPSLSVNRIEGGTKNNIIAEECTFIVDRRLLPGETAEDVLKQLQEAVKETLQPGFRCELSLVNDGWDPFITPAENPVVSDLIASYREEVGEEPVVRGKGGCTDASHIFKAGIPAVILGPGSANVSHTANEVCEIRRIALTGDILYKTSVRFLNEDS